MYKLEGSVILEFKEMQLKPELIEALRRVGFVSATEVQSEAIPILLQGKSIIARAKTGTGKTGAFIVEPVAIPSSVSITVLPFNAGYALSLL